MTKSKFFALATCLGSVGAFVPRFQHNSQHEILKANLRKKNIASISLAMEPDQKKTDVDGTSNDFMSTLPNLDLEGLAKQINLENLTGNIDQIKENVLDGEFGTRGEAYVAAQGFLVLCIVLGGVPFIGDALKILFGPVLLLIGCVVILKGLTDMGGSLNVWPMPSSKNNDLIISGIFGQIRHPIYSGLVCSMAGFSILTDSATRLILTIVLLYVLDVKSDVEEKGLHEKFGTAYSDYVSAVPGKFFPDELASKI